MLSKFQASILSILFLCIGLFAGWFLWNKPRPPLMQMDENPNMNSMMIDVVEKLGEKRGDDFDEAYLKDMIVNHQGAVEMARLGVTYAKHPEIIDFSQKIIDAQSAEISDMQTWLKNWYGQ